MIYPSFPPAPRDSLMTLFLGVYKAALVLFLVAVAGLVAGVVIDARNSLETPPPVSAFTNRH